MIECLLSEKEQVACFYCKYSSRDDILEDLSVHIDVGRKKKLNYDFSVLESAYAKLSAMSDFDYKVGVFPFLDERRHEAHEKHRADSIKQLNEWALAGDPEAAKDLIIISD